MNRTFSPRCGSTWPSMSFSGYFGAEAAAAAVVAALVRRLERVPRISCSSSSTASDWTREPALVVGAAEKRSADSWAVRLGGEELGAWDGAGALGAAAERLRGDEAGRLRSTLMLIPRDRLDSDGSVRAEP